jgi:aromatic ring-opening dioxygenase catalytic subunit (LigB family)
MSERERLPAYYIPHGGGPWHVMREDFGSDPGYAGLAAWLAELGTRHRGSVSSLLAISAHWEERVPTVHFGARPGMLYDYSGFPNYTYELSWPAPGDPELASRIEGLLSKAGFRTGRETERGFDHGTFVPMMIAQLSLVAGLDPAEHFDVGRALEPLRSEGVLIIGSGMSYHNMRGLMYGGPAVASDSRRFDDWLAEAAAVADPQERRAALADWLKAPGARECHPRSEHLVPLFLAAGAGGADPGRRDYSGELMGARISGIAFG